jgi:hypothetical protein
MVARVKHEPDALAVVFERDGEEPIRIEVADGDKALLRAVAILLAHRRLHVGDKLTVVATVLQAVS